MICDSSARHPIRRLRRAILLVAASAVAITLPAHAVTTVNGGTTLDLGGGIASDTGLVLIDGNLVNGQFAASESFDVRKGTISATLFGLGKLTKSGAGVVTLSGANAYSGGTEISAGTLRLEHSSALGFAIFPSVVAVTGGGFDLANAINIANQVVLDGADFDVNVDSGSAEWSGAISELSAPQGLTKTGAGTLVLSAANSYTGGTTVTGGTLRITETSNLGPGDVSITGGTINMIGPVSPVTLTTTVDTLNITDGDLLLTIASPPGPLGLRKITATNGYNFVATMGNTSTISMVLGGNANMSVSGGGTVNLSSLFTDYTGDVTLDGTKLTLGAEGFNANSITVSNGATIDYSSGHNQYPDIILTDGATKLNVDVNIGVQHGDISGAFGIEKTGAAALGYATAMSYTGVTTISGGYITLMNGLPGQYGSIAGDIAMNGGSLGLSRTDNALNLTGDISGNGQIFSDFAFGSGTLSGNNSFTGGIFLFGGKIRAGSSTAFGSGGTVGGVAGTTIDLNGFSLSIGGLTGDGTYDLGGQTLTLTGTGFSGGSIFTAGNLTVANGANQGLSGVDLSAIATLTLDGTLGIDGSGNVAPQSILLSANGHLDFEFMSDAEYVAANIGGAGTIFLNDRRLALGTGDIDVSLSSQISGSGGSLRKTGAGTLTLSGTNTFDGGIALEQGTLRLASSGAAGTGAITTTGSVISYANGVNNAAPIVINSSTTQLEVLAGDTAIQSGVISELSGPRPLEIIGGGTMALTADNTYTGKTTVSAGNVYLGFFTSTGSIAGDIELTNFGTNLVVLRTNDITIGGNISGNGALAKSAGAATVLTLSGNNTYIGGTAVNVGTVRAGSSTAFGTGYLFAASGATFDLNGFDITALNATGGGTFDLTGRTLTLTGGGTSNGTIFTAGNLSIASGADLTFNSVILTPISTLTVNGTMRLTGATTGAPGTIDLSSASGLFDISGLAGPDYTATSIAGAGAIDLGAKTLIAGGDNSDFALSGTITGAGGSLRKDGAGVLTLSGNNSFDGGIEVAAGTLRLANSAAAGTGVIRTTGSVIDYAANMNIGNHIVLDSNTTQLQVLTGIATHSGVIGESGGPRPLEKIGGGVLRLSATNTYTGLTTITDGRLQLIGAGTVSDTVNVAGLNAWLDFVRADTYTYGGVISGTSISQQGTGTLILTGANTHTWTGISDGTLRLDGAGTLGAANVTVALSGVGPAPATLDLNGTTQNIGILQTFQGWTQQVIGGTLNVSTFIFPEEGLISANLGGAATLVKNTNGTTVLSGNNTYTGQTTINGGTLVLQGGAALDDTNAVTVGAGATLQLDASETIGSLAGAGSIDLGVHTLTTGGNNSSTTFSGIINGAGGLSKVGSGIFILTGANTFAGALTVSGGFVKIGNGGASGDIAGDVVLANGNVTFHRSDDTTFAGAVSGSGYLFKGGSGELTLTGVNSQSGLNVSSNGRLTLGAGATWGAATVDVVMESFSGNVIDLGGTAQSFGSFVMNDGTLRNGSLNGPVMLTYGGTIQSVAGNYQLNKDGSNTLTLSGSNEFASGLNIDAGTAVAQGGSAIGDLNAVTVATGATLQLDGDEAIGSLAGGGNLALTTKTLTTGGNNTDTLWTGTIFGGLTSGLQKVGTGKFSVVGDMNHESTTVQSGELNFNGTALGNIAVNAGAKLSGTNTINGNLINLGTVASGNSPGTTTVLGNYTGGGTLEVEVQFDNAGSPINGTTHDFLNISGNVLGAPTAINLLTFTPSGSPAATTGNGIEIVRVGGTSTAGDFTMASYLLGGYYYNLAYLSNYIGGTVDSFFLQSSLATPGCSVDNTDNACFIDEAANLLGTPVDALAGNDTLQLNGATDFTFDVARLGTIYTNFEVFQKADTNTVTLTGTMADANQGIDIQNGTVIAGSGTLGAQGRVNIFTPGVLQVASNLTIGSIAGSGDVALGSNTLAAGGDNTSTLFSGVVSGSGVLQKDGAGTLTLSGANTHTGQTSLQDGGITIAGSGTLGAATVGLFVQGTLDLGGTSQTVGSLGMSVGSIQNGALIVNGNGFAQDGTISADLTVTGNFSKAFGSGTLTLSGNNTLSSVGIGSGTLIAANDQAITDTAAVNMSYIGFGVGPNLQIQSNQTIGSLSGDLFSGLNLGAFNLTTGGNNASTSFDGVISSSTGKLVKTGTGMLTLSGNNIFSFAGGINLMQGTLRLASDGAAGTGPITTFGSIIDYAAGVTNAAPVVINSATTQFQVTTGTATQSGVISELGGPRPFEKIGAGELILSGTNSVTGPTTVTAGTLTAQGGAAIADVSAVTVATGATFNLASNETIGALSGAGNVTLNANTLSAGGNGATTTFSGVISGNGGLTKSGSGTFFMTGANTYTGPTLVNGGAIAVVGGGQLGTGLVTLNASTALGFYNSTSAGARTFVNNAGGGSYGLFFVNASTAATASITNNGSLGFLNTATAANAFVTNASLMGFFNAATAGSATIQNNVSGPGLGLSFFNSSSAGSSSITSNASGALSGFGFFNTSTAATATLSNVTGLLTFNDTATAANATISNAASALTIGTAGLGFNGASTAGSSQITNTGDMSFNGTSTAASSTINTSYRARFIGDSNAGTANITNTAFGVLIPGEFGLRFIDNSRAAAATITNSGDLGFYNTASAQNASITSSYRTAFFDTASAGAATITNSASALTFGDRGLGFFNDSSAGTSQIFNNGDAGFTDNATAGNATIQNNGRLRFLANATAGASVITATAGSRTEFFDAASGGMGATLTLTGNAILDISSSTASFVELGTLSASNAASGIFLGGRTLAVGSGGGNMTIASAIADGGMAGGSGGALSKLGSGVLTLSGANSFTGPTTVNAGTLTLQGGSAIADTGAVTLAGGATLNLTSSETIGSLSGSAGSAVTLGGNALTLGGNGASTSIDGVISGAGGKLVKTGAGVITLTGANTFSGGIDLAQGTLRLGSNGAAGAGPITTLGAVVIDYATLVTNAAPIILGSNTTQVQVATFATQSGVISETGGARGLEKIGFGTLALTAANTYTGLTTVSQGRVQLIGNGALAGNVQLATSTSLIFDRTTPYTYSGVISGAGSIVQGQVGTITLTGANTHAATTVGLGTLRLSGAGTLGASNAQVIVFGVGSTLDLGGTTQTIGSLQLSQDASNSVINGTLNVATSILTTDGTFGVNLGGTAGLTKSGTGTVILSGANSYSGATTIIDGTLRLQGGAAIADLGAITVTSPGVLQLANSETVGSVGGTGNVVLGANILTLGGNNASTTLSGVVSGVGGKLVKQGSGMLTLSGANTFTGGIDVFHGTLTLGSNTAAGTGPITTFGTVINYLNLVNNASPIVISSNTTQLQQIGGTATQSGAISEVGGSRPLEKIGNGNLTLSGTNTFTGPMTISDGTLTLQGGAALADGVAVIVTAPGALALNTSEVVGSLAGSGNLTMSGGTALTAGGTNASTLFSGNMTGGGFTKSGSGNFTFTGTGTFGGPLNVNAGTFTKTGGGLSGASAFNTAFGTTTFLGATTAGVNGAGIAATGMGAIGINGTLYLDDNTTLSGTTLTMGTSPTLGVFLTTNTSVYPQITVSGAASVSGTLGVYLDPLTFSATPATTFTYDNVIAGSSRTGTFTAVNLLQSPSGLFSVAAAYGANDVDLTVTRSSFTLLGGGGGNSPSVGGAVEDIFVIGTTDPDLLNLISTIGASSPSAIAAIYAALSGSTSAETTGGGLRTDDPWKQTVAERINAARAPGCTVAGETWCLRRYAQAPAPVISDVQGNPSAFDWLETGIRDAGTQSAWLRAVGSWSQLDGSDFAAGSKQLTGGFIGGIDHVFNSLLLAGVAGQYLETSADFDNSRNGSHIRSAQLGAYLSYGGAEAYVNANASMIGTQARSERFATVGLVQYEIDSFMRGLALTASAEAGTILEFDGYRFEPSVALNYQYGQTDDYAERGGGGLSLLVRPDDSESLRSVLTARLSRVFDAGDRKIVPQIRLDWRHEHLDRGQSFTAAFAGAPTVLFDVEGTPYARDQFTVGAGVTVPIAGRLSGYADALGTFSEDATAATVLVGVRATW